MRGEVKTIKYFFENTFSVSAAALALCVETSSYLCPWVKVLRQHVGLSLSGWSLWAINLTESPLCLLYDTSIAHCCCRPHICTDPNNTQSLWESSKTLSVHVWKDDKLWVLSNSLCLREQKQINTAIFWICWRYSNIKANFLFVFHLLVEQNQ